MDFSAQFDDLQNASPRPRRRHRLPPPSRATSSSSDRPAQDDLDEAVVETKRQAARPPTRHEASGRR